MKKNDLGLVHIYCGEGKGKTTCSVGLTVRACGYGLHVLFMQFLKSGDSSELKILKSLPGIEVLGTKPIKKFSFQMTEEEKEETRQINAEQFADMVKMLENDHYDMLVLDEVLGSIEAGLLDDQLIVNFLKNRPEQLEVVMTGRYPTAELEELADYVSRIDKVKHPYDKGIPARAGIEA
ncbi:cob(I)yrinic acid a,c-diamide adenosyltransferase [Anaerovoracaceae bacterium 41-7]|uniref:Cob(I)yrinic acid a,c-diamide adenosyltransferase n=1 Tax=Anaerotruncus colihominis TaxID=169435 RepID=A0A845QKE3_9FIRM|nr:MULTISPECIES: cob(I)yrinic acid a,c-diamide adenosyltransferase [Eubacteriales]MCI9638885.1 cob(I)yrinic acid a,c-diamide adenosyltransferase [Emergencia sp.]NBH61914.1 cob(I)yrinic acid a,c-diamide adenosyltransferase [Anaerotruncus colihominis]NCF02569.1 cob(I)yrinic acid a,c-diamide adenosyltransferase [Anaerotruncus sp. 80]